MDAQTLNNILKTMNEVKEVIPTENKTEFCKKVAEELDLPCVTVDLSQLKYQVACNKNPCSWG